MMEYNQDDLPYKQRLPKRWTEFTQLPQSVVRETRFIPCKVPLEKEYFDKWHPNVERFTPEMLLRTIMKNNVGLVIDLTDTTRYYDGGVFENEGIEYAKIRIKGQQVPGNEEYQAFRDIVDNFVANEEMRGKLIVVHCTHGVNRTGFMVCRYMIDKLRVSTDQAVAAFNRARGHAMEKYIDELKATEGRL